MGKARDCLRFPPLSTLLETEMAKGEKGWLSCFSSLHHHWLLDTELQLLPYSSPFGKARDCPAFPA